MNLFTFNFKKFYISFVIFFLASILFFIIGSEIIIRYLVVQNSTYEIIRDDLRNKKNDFAVFADSRGANGFEDSKNFSNFSLPGNNLMSIIKMAEFHIEKNQLKGIIVQLDPHLFSNYRLFDNQSKSDSLDLVSQVSTETKRERGRPNSWRQAKEHYSQLLESAHSQISKSIELFESQSSFVITGD